MGLSSSALAGAGYGLFDVIGLGQFGQFKELLARQFARQLLDIQRLDSGIEFQRTRTGARLGCPVASLKAIMDRGSFYQVLFGN